MKVQDQPPIQVGATWVQVVMPQAQGQHRAPRQPLLQNRFFPDEVAIAANQSPLFPEADRLPVPTTPLPLVFGVEG